MKKKSRRIWILLTALLTMCAILMGTGCAGASGKNSGKNSGKTGTEQQKTQTVSEDEEYTSKDEVALYIHLYEHLPDNFITKSEAKKLGWESKKGNLWEVAPGKSIGGDSFGNREGQLPEKNSRKYYECDVDYQGGFRDEKRIVYSNDGLIYYTEDHYNGFEQLYGEND